MKFTPDTLIQIYLDGAFTEEAQAEFDRLMREDPSFSQKVTNAVAERVGPAPEALLSQAEARLDGRVQGLWAAHRPSPFQRLLKKASVLLAVAVGSGLLYFGYKNLGGKLLSPMEVEPLMVQGGPLKGQPTLRLEKVPGTSHPDPKRKNPSSGPGRASQEETRKEGPSVSLAQAAVSGPDRGRSHPAGGPSMGEAGLPQKGSPGASAPLPSRTSPRFQEGFPLRLEIETDRRQEVAVTVLDPGGLPVRSLYRGVWEAGAHFVDWDGLDNSGNPLPPGTYTVVLNAGGKVQSGTVTIHPIQ
jgi:hypothetical protein